MRRLLLLLALACASTSAARAGTLVGLGVFGGGNFPVSQEDQDSGSEWGVRLPVHVRSLLTLEPYFRVAQLGHAASQFRGLEYAREGFAVVGYGASVAFGSLGMRRDLPVYPFVGIGSYRLSRAGAEPLTDTGYNFGLAAGIPVAKGFSLNVRAAYTVVPDAARNFVDVNLGTTFQFFPLPW